MDAVDGDDDDVIFLDQVEVTASARQETLESTCKNHLLALFPDITSDYLDEISSLHAFNAEAAASAILDQYPNLQYPKSAANPLKRKRSDDSDEEKEPEVARTMKAKLSANNYLRNLDSRDYQDLARSLISQEFPRVPVLTIRNSLLENRQSLFEAYTKLDDAFRSWDDANPPWKAKTRPSKVDGDFTPERFANLDLSKYNEAQQAAIEELRAARELRSIKDAKIMAEAEEKSNFTRAQKDGQITECGCCYNDCALNRMVQCSGDVIHWFCRDCMRSQAEAQIGLSKYELTCMSVDGCTAGFSHAQRELFLDKKLSTALCRIEQEAVLREAGIENLETCPFCPYAAEYPTIDVNKEFRCEDPDCGRVSCRLCRKDTHIPKTCAEAAADEGIDARHILEEAMSAALIRTCNKCKNPFIKQDGCNKIICTKCHTIQCDVCRKTVKDYSHFNDAGRGGKIGQCPLFDTTEQRHQEEVRQAEEATRKRVAEENPELLSVGRVMGPEILRTPKFQ
ncbi:hypothetical protein F4778DRAFT_775109 [Xylariomycetidae sp. FL2044]|nr:hypothetical protein F4778DRAFT_775109 [Xylariomycetidae sp. FL2044]